MGEVPQIAIIGAGIFVTTEYIPTLANMSHLFVLKAIWSRSQESARSAVEIARSFFPEVECKWGDGGLDEIIKDSSINGVAVVLAGQILVETSLRLLKAGKHVLQEKPAASSVSEVEFALSSYHSLISNLSYKPFWAVAENYRFEPALVEAKKQITEIGDIMNVQFIFEGSMDSSSPYYSTSWRWNLNGGFIYDIGVHFVAGLRMLTGSEITSVSALTSHVDKTLPLPDNISSTFQLENGFSGVFVMVVSSRSPKVLWRIVGLNGTLQVEPVYTDGKLGYMVSLFLTGGQNKSFIFPSSGVSEELKTFLSDISQAALKKDDQHELEPRLSFLEGARDVAVLNAMLESGSKQGTPVQVKRF